MGSSWAFKITASIVKPTRESLLDYCSYIMIILSLIGIARVWISGSGLREECGDEYSSDRQIHSARRESDLDTLDIDASGEFPNTTMSDVLVVERTDALQSMNISGVTSLCPKYYQATFAYVLLIESMILLFAGLLWAKVPRVSHTLCRFTEVLRECQTSDWAKRALNVVTGRKSVSDMSQSLYSFMSSECVNYDMRSLLDTLFHPDNNYRAKSKARHLYETVQTFCEKNSRLTDVWKTYILKSALQFIWWILVFNVNLVLFVMLEFYVMCSEEINAPCDHDTFLRIIWFMGESVLFVYGVFICKTLKWLNEKSIVRHGVCSCLTIRCICGHTRYNKPEKGPLLKCRAYRFDANLPVYNDMALMLHLLEEAHPKLLPYFVVFMFSEWKEKLTSFANPVWLSDVPLCSSMQMLSGRPPPIIEITDISMPDIISKSISNSSIKPETKKKAKAAVTFYIEGDSSSGDEQSREKGKDESPGSHHSQSTESRPETVNMVHLPPPRASSRRPLTNGLVSNHVGPPAGVANAPAACRRHLEAPEKERGKKQVVHSLDDVASNSDWNGTTTSIVVNETSVLVHKSSSSESMQSCGKRDTDSSDASVESETHMLL